jgi:uncharacterized protein DUF5615
VKALLDEQLSPQIAVLLREAGYDAISVAKRLDLVGSNDSTILEVATGEGRAVVTNNIKDLRPLAAERLAQGRKHEGLILVPSTRTRIRAAVTALAGAIEKVLREHPTGLQAASAGSGRF